MYWTKYFERFNISCATVVPCSDLISGVIEGGKQVLDHLPVERERGITVKAQTATMVHHHKGQKYLLNLIDTPVWLSIILYLRNHS